MSEEKPKITDAAVRTVVLRMLNAGLAQMKVERRDHRVIGDIESFLHGVALQHTTELENERKRR